MVTIAELLRGTLKVLPTSYENRRQAGLKLDHIKINNMKGMKQKVIVASIRSTSGKSSYNCVIAFNGLEDPENDIPSLSKTPVQVWSSDPSFYFWFGEALKKVKALYGGRLKKYTPVSPSARKRKAGPPKNPKMHVGMSKHLWFLVEVLKAEGIVS